MAGPEGSTSSTASMRDHDNNLALDLGFFLTLDVQAFAQFKLEIPLAPLPFSITISLTKGPEIDFKFLEREPIFSICLDLSKCGIATDGYPQLGAGLGRCNDDYDKEIFRKEALVPISDIVRGCSPHDPMYFAQALSSDVGIGGAEFRDQDVKGLPGLPKRPAPPAPGHSNCVAPASMHRGARYRRTHADGTRDCRDLPEQRAHGVLHLLLHLPGQSLPRARQWLELASESPGPLRVCRCLVSRSALLMSNLPPTFGSPTRTLASRKNSARRVSDVHHPNVRWRSPDVAALGGTLTGEIKLLRFDGSLSRWEQQDAALDCTDWARRYAETVTFTVPSSQVFSNSMWLIAGTGLTRWGHGACASGHNPCDVSHESCRLGSCMPCQN